MLIIYKRIVEILKDKGQTKKSFCEAIGISEDTLANWKNVFPRSKHLIDAACYLNVSIDYLVGITDKGGLYSQFPNNNTPNMEKLISFIKQQYFSNEQADIILEVIREIQKFNR